MTELDTSQIGAWIGPAFERVASALVATEAGPYGLPFARLHRIGGSRFTIEAGYACAAHFSTAVDVTPTILPGGPAVAVWHVGPYNTMSDAYNAIDQWLTTNGADPVGDAWEVYHSDPTYEPDPATWRTEVVQPYRRR